MGHFFEETSKKTERKAEKIDWDKAKTVHVDAGATMTADYEPESAYFTAFNDNGRLLHHAESIGPMWAVEAEYHAISWALENIMVRPLIVTNDNEAAIQWSYDGANTDKHDLPRLISGRDEKVIYRKENVADEYNRKHC